MASDLPHELREAIVLVASSLDLVGIDFDPVVNELPDPIVVYDDEGQYDLVNDAAAEIRDVSLEELVGTKSPYLEQIQQENPDEYEALLDGSQDTLRTDLVDEFPGRGNRTLRCDLSRVTTGTESTGTVIVTRDVNRSGYVQTALVRFRI